MTACHRVSQGMHIALGALHMRVWGADGVVGARQAIVWAVSDQITGYFERRHWDEDPALVPGA